MNANDYRRQIERSIARVQASPSRPVRRARARDPRDVLADRKAAAKTRAEALGRVTQAESPEEVPQTALDRLSDPKESSQLRLAAIRLLQQKAFLSPTFAEWRPQFVDSLRKAVGGSATVRGAALEVLSLLKDRPTQDLLLQGLRQPRRALVPAHEALRLLSADIHADVIDAARKLIRSPQVRRNKATSLQATRILAADPASVSTLEKVLGSDAYALDVRRAAATALSHLSPEKLESVEKTAPPPAAARRRGKAKSRFAAKETPAARRSAKPLGALARHIATLQRVRR